MATITKLSLPLSGDTADRENALVKFQNRLGASAPITPVLIERTYTNGVLTTAAAVFETGVPDEMIQAAFRAMVNVAGRTQSGFAGTMSFSNGYYQGPQSLVYNV